MGSSRNIDTREDYTIDHFGIKLNVKSPIEFLQYSYAWGRKRIKQCLSPNYMRIRREKNV